MNVEENMNEIDERTDIGMLEVLRIYEEKRDTLIKTIDITRSNVRFIITATSIFLIVFILFSTNTQQLTDWKRITLTVLEAFLLVLNILIFIYLIKPLQMFDWMPGISGDREKLLDYYYGQSNEEVINRKIEVLRQEIKLNRENVNQNVKKVNTAQILFNVSVIILLLMCIVILAD